MSAGKYFRCHLCRGGGREEGRPDGLIRCLGCGNLTAPPMSRRFSVVSAGGRTRVTDCRTGEDLTPLCTSAEFVHDAGGHPVLRITLRDDFEPDVSIEGAEGP